MASALLMRGQGHWLVATAIFIALAVANAHPLALAPAGTIGAHGDAYFSVWRLAWVAHQIRSGAADVFDANIFYPESNTLAYSDAMLLPSALVAPLHWAGVDPVLIYNAVLLGAFVASGLAAYALVRWLTASAAAGVMGGLIFALSPHRMEHFDHLELQFAFWIPLAALAWHRAVESRRVSSYVGVSAIVCGQLLSSIYHGIFLMAWLAVMNVAWFRTRWRESAIGLAGTLLPAALLLAVYSLPYLHSRAAVGERSRTEVASYSARPLDFVSAPDSNVLYGWTAEFGANERRLFPGLVALGLTVAGIVRVRDRRIRIHLAGLLFALLLVLGTNAGLYSLLYDWVLPFRGLRVPARAAILLLLGTAVFSGAAVAWLLARFSRARWLAPALIAVAAAEFATVPVVIPADRDISPWYRTLGTLDDVVIFEWPVTVPWRLHDMRDVRYMYRSLAHWRPLLNGYSGNYPRSYQLLLLEMRAFPYTSALNYLRERGATVLIVHDIEGSRPSYDEALARLHREPGVHLIASGLDSGHRVSFFRLTTRAETVAERDRR
jgi:hypothetical protein